MMWENCSRPSVVPSRLEFRMISEATSSHPSLMDALMLFLTCPIGSITMSIPETHPLKRRHLSKLCRDPSSQFNICRGYGAFVGIDAHSGTLSQSKSLTEISIDLIVWGKALSILQLDHKQDGGLIPFLLGPDQALNMLST